MYFKQYEFSKTNISQLNKIKQYYYLYHYHTRHEVHFIFLRLTPRPELLLYKLYHNIIIK